MPSGDDEDDRRIAGLLLRDARTRAERAEEEGNAAYLDDSRRAFRINERLLKGEISQVRSFNKRCGVDAADLPTQTKAFMSDAQRQANALEREFVRRAHELRGTVGTVETIACGSAPRTKRQRTAAGGQPVDIAAAEEEEARQAEQDVELANPLLRPPEGSARKTASRKLQQGDEAPAIDQAVFWPSKRLRVRVVDEDGKFKACHLKKGVVRHVDIKRFTVDVEIDGDGELVRSMPQDCLETVVSKTCSRVEIVRGAHRGITAQLLQRNPKHNIAAVRLGRGFDEAEFELPLDDVCEFV